MTERTLEDQNHDLLVSNNQLLERARVAEWRFEFAKRLTTMISAWVDSMHRHKKRNSIYVRLGGGFIQTEEPLKDGDRVEIYMARNGVLFARREHEFFDGRFERL